MDDFGNDEQSAAREIKRRMSGLDPFIQLDNYMSKLLAPVERVLGITDEVLRYKTIRLKS